MIKLTIKKSQYFDLIGSWDYEKNEIKIGYYRNKINDIRIHEETDQSLVITVKNNLLLLNINQSDDKQSILVNNKKTIGQYFLKKGDLIKIKNTSIEIIDFDETSTYHSEFFNDQQKKMGNEENFTEKLIEIIEDDLKNI